MRETYAPSWAPHASGSFDREIGADGKPEPTWVMLTCAVCAKSKDAAERRASTHRVKCTGGTPRAWVARWASAHLHRDPMKVDALDAGKKST